MILLFITLISIFVTVVISLLARGSTFDGVGSDAFKQVNAAAHFSEWGGWPSGMHKFIKGKARMKDVGVLLLVPMQRILNDKAGFYPVVMVSNLAHAVSGTLIFLVAENYWGSEAGLALFILYIFCFWPYMIVLHGGLQIVAQMFFLFSVFSLQQTEVSMMYTNIAWYFASGLSFGLMNFSSASARKFIPVYIMALIYHTIDVNTVPWREYGANYDLVPGAQIIIGILIAILTGLVILTFTYKRIVKLVYDEKINFFSFRGKNENDIEIYHKKARIMVTKLFRVPVILSIIVLIFVYFRQSETYLFVFSAVVGFLSAVIYLILPNPRSNLRGYMNYWIIVKWGSHHPIYDEYFKKKYGKIFTEGKEGWIWYFKFFKRMIPFHMLLYSISIVMIGWEIFVSPKQENLSILLLVLITIMPIIWGELTIGPKASLPMYTSLIPLFLPIGYIISESSVIGLRYFGYEFNYYLWIIIAISSAWNSYIFITDILPCRMTAYRIMKTLDKHQIKKFYTYDTLFNYPFVGIIKHFFSDKYNIEYISSIDQIDNGYVFVPCTGSKSAYFQSARTIGPVGDFKEDDVLNLLIDTKEIQQCSIASFKSLGNSKYWQQLGNIVSFRDLILKEVQNEDRFRGYAWLLKKEKNISYNSVKDGEK